MPLRCSWRPSRRCRPSWWTCWALGGGGFRALAVALLIRAIDEAARPEWTVKVLVCFLLAFPYLLLRFTESFVAVPAVMARVAIGLLAALLAATVALPYFPEDGAARPG